MNNLLQSLRGVLSALIGFQSPEDGLLEKARRRWNEGRTNRPSLLVPVIAVQSRNGKKFVRVLGPGDKPERREVTTGIADGIHIQILSGLKEGDAVITAQVTQQERDAQVQQRHRGPRL